MNRNQFNTSFVSKTRFSLISVDHSPHEYKVLLSAKWQISDCSMFMSMSLVNILNKIGHKN